MLDTLIYWDLPSQNGSSSAVGSVYENPSDAVTCPLHIRPFMTPSGVIAPMPYPSFSKTFVSLHRAEQKWSFSSSIGRTQPWNPPGQLHMWRSESGSRKITTIIKSCSMPASTAIHFCASFAGDTTLAFRTRIQRQFTPQGQHWNLIFHHWHQCEKVPSETCVCGVQPSF